MTFLCLLWISPLQTGIGRKIPSNTDITCHLPTKVRDPLTREISRFFLTILGIHILDKYQFKLYICQLECRHRTNQKYEICTEGLLDLKSTADLPR
jgi:hypothetical protein